MRQTLFGISVLAGFVSIILYIITNIAIPKQIKPLFTSEQLSKFNGIVYPHLYLSVLGRVFNVTKGADHYGPGKTYHFFVGKDTSRSFVTGQFEDVNSDLTDLSQEDLRSLNYWIKFYFRNYQYIGKLIGKYYNERGKATPYRQLVKKLIKEAQQAKENGDEDKKKFPPCNVEWDLERGSHFWCTNKSGGIARDWSGVPRQFYKAGAENYVCVCANEHTEQMGQVKEFPDCDETGQHCYVK